MLRYILLALVSISSQQPQIPENTYETCTMKLDRGDACCAAPNNSIRFFFDDVLEQCFTYLYEGCGGGRNTFYTESECYSTCMPADKFNCGGNKPPVGGCHELDMNCPAGSTCIQGALGVGLCCEDVEEARWAKEINPTCTVGQVLLRNVWYGTEIWLGKSCAHRQVVLLRPFGVLERKNV
ncbi:unnamed protein product [Cylicocyclus nassatus]|uniref:BPTI/Kunitz inhibitor domain-containing protein n=1 Tax=Cylicocyclus nassatus TaxID=53992 RepID=A0AA36DU53_CYLNA|nr:unnamed protein product [Cylicocyclus nassatus]